MKHQRVKLALLGAIMFSLSACTATTTPTSPTTSPSITPITSPTATSTGKLIDFTQPGAAKKMVAQLLKTAKESRAFYVEVQRNSVTVSVLKNSVVKSWAYRDGKIQEVRTDVQYVKQASFDPNNFNFENVGALFRMAASISGSDDNQQLRIVDFSDGEIAMTVSTVPESRTVFFNANGSPLIALDFTTEFGIKTGFDDVTKNHPEVSAITISNTAISIDYSGPNNGTIRRTRLPLVPPSLTNLSDKPGQQFKVSDVSISTIYQVYQQLLGNSPKATAWRVEIKYSNHFKQVVMEFSVGSKKLTTDTSGIVLS